MNQTQICPNCQTANGLQNVFCQSCGTHLKAEEPQPTPLPQQRPGEFSQIYSPPPAQPQSSYQPAIYGTLRIDKLGARLDGWADLVEGAGDKAEQVQAALDQELEGRRMPQVGISRNQLTPGGLVGKRRDYQLAQSYTGATMAAYVGKFGSDLYIAWDIFVRPVILWRNIAIMAGIAGFLALCPTVIGGGLSDETLALLTFWIVSTVFWMIPIGVVALVAGRLLRGSFLAFFIEEIDHFAADDVAAMMLAVHKSMLKAIDEAGLDSSLLRSKEQYAGGRRERII